VDREISSPRLRDLQRVQKTESAKHRFTRRSILQLMAGAVCASNVGVGRSASRDWNRWLVPQDWEKRKDGPVISLGEPGAFDDMHIFAPFVVHEKGLYSMLYPGSRGTVPERVFRLGLATSHDGIKFNKAPGSVFEFGDGITSIVTPVLLCQTDGTPIREDGKLRMWFTGADLTKRGGKHILHEVSGTALDRWGKPSAPLLQDCYAPTVIKEGSVYRMWYTDVSVRPWKFRHARSEDGTRWSVTEKPVMVVDQSWEAHILVYPQVVKTDGLYLMWYGSYWWDNEDAVRWPTTAIGFAVSSDGLEWHKYEKNPVLRPDADLPWETHYNTSHSVMRLADGSWRIWYGGRKQPPFLNKYFSIGTATWKGPS
jgi:hypothetical protein